jgi:hypothetical protein
VTEKPIDQPTDGAGGALLVGVIVFLAGLGVLFWVVRMVVRSVWVRFCSLRKPTTDDHPDDTP